MSEVNEAVLDAPVVTQTKSSCESFFGCPCPRGDVHAINGISRYDFSAVHDAALEMDLNVNPHVIGGSVDRARRTIENLPVSVRRGVVPSG